MASKKKRPRGQPDPDAQGLEVSPAFRKRPSRKVIIRGGPPDIPRNVIPVLRKPPIVIVHTRAKPSKRLPKTVSVTPKNDVASRTRAPRALEKRLPADKAWTPPATLHGRPAAGPRSPQHALRTTTTQSEPGSAPKEVFAPARSRPIRLGGAAPLHPVRERRMTKTGLLGATILAVSLVMIVLYHVTPWIEITGAQPTGPSPFTGMEPGVKGARELSETSDQGLYFARLVNWPLSTLVWSALVGGALFAIDAVPRLRVDHHAFLQGAGLSLLLFVGFVEMVAGARWVGLYVSTLVDAGPTPVHLVFFPYIGLLLGAAQCLLAARRLTSKSETLTSGVAKLRIPCWTVLACALSLVLAPIVPLGAMETEGGQAFLQEGELASGGARDEAFATATQNYEVARALVWLTFYMSVGALGVGALAERSGLAGVRTAFLLVYGSSLPVLLGIGILAALAQYSFSRVAAASTFLAILFATTSALAALYFVFVRVELLPYLRRLPALPD